MHLIPLMGVKRTKPNIQSGHPDVSIEVDDVDAVCRRAVKAGCEIVYPSPTKIGDCGDSSSEAQNGAVINVTQHG